ncbi:MAG: PilT/PilU family type 4a pilus ATPase [Deltaproteobacteria bacterium]|nr:PilT/PilU family type 4a pilus ATPase [Deltaproteobacteria bacterium]
MARIDSFLRLVVEQRASDLHFTAGSVPLIRHDGELVPLPFRSLTEGEARRFLFEILTPEERERLEVELELDLLYALPGVGRFRANLFQQQQGWGAAFRIIPDRPPLLDELGFPAAVRGLCALQQGLVLIGGPTGSGKSTTLAALVHEINRTTRRHVLTVEDPIEFLHEPVLSAVTQRQVGIHVESFAEALRSALRESPDVLVVGEVRDSETMQLAVQAAETGVLVVGTLHTSSAAKTITRAIDMAAEDIREQLRASLSVLLKGVVAQHLLRRASGDGRIAAVEVLLNNPAVASMIRENKIVQIDAYLAGTSPWELGMQGLESCLLAFVRDGLVDVEEAAKLSASPEVLRREVARLKQEGAA